MGICLLTKWFCYETILSGQVIYAWRRCNAGALSVYLIHTLFTFYLASHLLRRSNLACVVVWNERKVLFRQSMSVIFRPPASWLFLRTNLFILSIPLSFSLLHPIHTNPKLDLSVLTMHASLIPTTWRPYTNWTKCFFVEALDIIQKQLFALVLFVIVWNNFLDNI